MTVLGFTLRENRLRKNFVAMAFAEKLLIVVLFKEIFMHPAL